ncbi:hypothetical protein C7M84_020844 [Penaeus vannamei]|uniref:Uncharacterized protein n=1 Tax=Penaeus vannamei TaxID=6689 RepID=A0A3R7LWU8_PENVA|nr:hypothetical protein C7M84_020844 [Penaeus vannamei]
MKKTKCSTGNPSARNSFRPDKSPPAVNEQNSEQDQAPSREISLDFRIRQNPFSCSGASSELSPPVLPLPFSRSLFSLSPFSLSPFLPLSLSLSPFSALSSPSPPLSLSLLPLSLPPPSLSPFSLSPSPSPLLPLLPSLPLPLPFFLSPFSLLPSPLLSLSPFSPSPSLLLPSPSSPSPSPPSPSPLLPLSSPALSSPSLLNLVMKLDLACFSGERAIGSGGASQESGHLMLKQDRLQRAFVRRGHGKCVRGSRCQVAGGDFHAKGNNAGSGTWRTHSPGAGAIVSPPPSALHIHLRFHISNIVTTASSTTSTFILSSRFLFTSSILINARRRTAEQPSPQPSSAKWKITCFRAEICGRICSPPCCINGRCSVQWHGDAVARGQLSRYRDRTGVAARYLS